MSQGPDHRPRTSVALCTYNGARYLPEQLQSILGQTRLPGELVVFDDGSNDDTVALLRGFAERAPFPVRVSVNEGRVGPAENFSRAIAAATGEIILLCDQDDVWHADRVEQTEAAFAPPTAPAAPAAECPAAPPAGAAAGSVGSRRPGLVFADADVCDCAARPLGYRLWDSLFFPPRLRRRVADHGFDVLLRQNVASGATMAFDARFRSMFLPVGPGWMHDGWIALLIAAVAPVRVIDRPLIRYRQHPQQTVGALRRSLYQQIRNARAMHRDVFLQHANLYAAVLQRLEQTPDVPPRNLELLRAKVHHLQRRSRIRRRESARLLPSLAELVTGRYRHYSLGWKSFAQDLLL